MNIIDDLYSILGDIYDLTDEEYDQYLMEGFNEFEKEFSLDKKQKVEIIENLIKQYNFYLPLDLFQEYKDDLDWNLISSDYIGINNRFVEKFGGYLNWNCKSTIQWDCHWANLSEEVFNKYSYKDIDWCSRTVGEIKDPDLLIKHCNDIRWLIWDTEQEDLTNRVTKYKNKYNICRDFLTESNKSYIQYQIKYYEKLTLKTQREIMEERKIKEKCTFIGNMFGQVTVCDKSPKPEKEFNNMILSHGILTHFCNDDFNITVFGKDEYFKMITTFKKVLNGGNNMLLSCSNENQNLGPVGFYLKGNNILVGKEDLETRVWDGVLSYRDLNERYLISKVEDYILSDEIHSEHIVNKYEISGIWFKKAYLPTYYKIYKFLKQFCLESNLEFKLLSDFKMYVGY